ncbi:MAG: isoprenylcysteine carboxylmethyltransferase family protein [Rhodospirillaceae bacterium]|nr:isoprenylcysteine carboxylmethyltransferase family protein [Rhodospirillaceae bacterium]
MVDPFHAAFLVFTLAIGGLRGFYQWRNRANQPVRHDATLLDRALLVFAIIAMMPVPLLQIFTPVFAFFDVAIAHWLSVAGVILLVAAVWMFWRSHADLGANWSAQLAIQAAHVLVERGVYRRIRHPMYASLLLAGIGQFLVLHNWIGGGSIFVTGVLFYFIRIPKEEALLIGQFGASYRDYMRRTGRVLPRILNVATIDPA